MLVSLVERVCAWLKHPLRGRGEYAIYCRICRAWIGYRWPGDGVIERHYAFKKWRDEGRRDG